VNLAVVALELEGTHFRTAPRGPPAPAAGAAAGAAAAGAAGEAGAAQGTDVASLAGKSAAEVHWQLLRDDLGGAVTAAAHLEAHQAAFEHRERVQDFWLKDWTHEGFTLREAKAQMTKNDTNLSWVQQWFRLGLPDVARHFMNRALESGLWS